MKNILKYLPVFAILIHGIHLSAQVKQMDIEDSFSMESLEHPYLLFDQESKENLLREIDSNPDLKEIYDRQILEGYRFLKMPIDDQIPGGGDLSRFFSGNEMRRFMGLHYGAALNLAFVYQLTGEEKYADKAFLHAEMLCRLESWVHQFHEFPQIYDRVWPWNVADDQVVFSYDLQSARIATHMALVYDWIYTAMNKDQRNRIRGALLEKAITRVRGNFEYHWWASAYRCNWSGICYSGAGIASLALLTEDPHLTDVVATAYNGVSHMLDEIGPDGGWQEGRGYWAYGVGHSMWFMDAVKRLSGEKYNLFQHTRLKDKPADFPLYTLPANFGDGRSGPVGDSWFINKLVTETGDQTAAWYSEEFVRPGSSIYDLIWPKSTIKGVEPGVKSKYFSGIDWATMRSSFHNDASFTIACKAGLNDDPHHGHLDCGQFILSYKGDPFIKDHGSAKYDDFYFSAERWDYIEASSRGHNVIYVNGEEQISAKLKDQPWKEGIGGNIDNLYTSDSMDYLSMTGLQNAYPGVEMSSWQREIILKKPSMVVVLDRVGSEKDAEIRSRLHPGGKLQTEKGYFTIETTKGRIAVVPFSDKKVVIEAGKHGSITVNDDIDFEWIPYVDCVVKADSEHTLSGYIIFPDDGSVTAEDVINTVKVVRGSGEEVNLSFELAEKLHNVPFPQGKDN